MKYLRQIHETPDNPFMGPKWAHVKAASMIDAAAAGLKLDKFNGNKTAWIYIAEDRPGNRYPNGKPFMVQRYRIEILAKHN